MIGDRFACRDTVLRPCAIYRRCDELAVPYRAAVDTLHSNSTSHHQVATLLGVQYHGNTAATPIVVTMTTNGRYGNHEYVTMVTFISRFKFATIAYHQGDLTVVMELTLSKQLDLMVVGWLESIKLKLYSDSLEDLTKWG